MRILYVVSRMRPWESLDMKAPSLAPISFHIQAPKGSPGVLLVYDSVEAAHAAHPNLKPHELLAVAVKPPKEET